MNSLKKYRYEKDLSQLEMAKLLDISDSSYSLYENNRREMPYKTLIKFLKLSNENQDNALLSVLNEFLRRND